MLLKDVSPEERAFCKQAESLSKDTDQSNEVWQLSVEVNKANSDELKETFMLYLPTANRNKKRKLNDFSSITLGYLHSQEGSRAPKSLKRLLQ